MHQRVAVVAQDEYVGRLEYEFGVDARLRDRDDVVPVGGRYAARLAPAAAFLPDRVEHRQVAAHRAGICHREKPGPSPIPAPTEVGKEKRLQ